MKRTLLILAAVVLIGAVLPPCDRNKNEKDNNRVDFGNSTADVTWVDLGLPSGLLWADRNVGADSPEDYGNYYAWGETSPKEIYDWNTYLYGNDNHELTKYCSQIDDGLNGYTDNSVTLEASDDAATANLGGKARTPKNHEWQELMANTTAQYTTRNGVYGCLFTASNGKSIFLPAAGNRSGSKIYTSREYCRYWSSTLHTVYPSNAWYFVTYPDELTMTRGHRYLGYSVRAVRDSKN